MFSSTPTTVLPFSDEPIHEKEFMFEMFSPYALELCLTHSCISSVSELIYRMAPNASLTVKDWRCESQTHVIRVR